MYPCSFVCCFGIWFQPSWWWAPKHQHPSGCLPCMFWYPMANHDSTMISRRNYGAGLVCGTSLGHPSFESLTAGWDPQPVESFTLYPDTGLGIPSCPIPWFLQIILSGKGWIKRHSFHQIKNDSNINKNPKLTNITLREGLNELKKGKKWSCISTRG